MALPNDSITVTPGTGATIATELISSKEYPVVMQADSSGHLLGTLPTYLYMTPSAVVGAEKLYFDLFNASGSGKVIDVRGIWIIPDTDVAVNPSVGLRIDLYRTSEVGTGGTTASYKSATRDVGGGNFCPMDTDNAALPAEITARWLPTGGATISEWVIANYSMGEETSAGVSYLIQFENILPSLTWGQKFALREGQGILMKQGSVASAGNTSFLVAFTLE